MESSKQKKPDYLISNLSGTKFLALAVFDPEKSFNYEWSQEQQKAIVFSTAVRAIYFEDGPAASFIEHSEEGSNIVYRDSLRSIYPGQD